VPARVAFAVVLSVVTAFLYALSNVLELTEAEKVPDDEALKPGLLLKLVRRPRWLLGLLSDVGGYLTQAGALALAAVAFVEPILASGIIMALVLGAWLTHRRVQRRDWVAALLLSGGLAFFLYEVSPTGGRDIAPSGRWIAAGPALLAVIVVCVASARAFRGPTRAALLGIGAGIAFGASAVLTKALVHYFDAGVFGWVPHWEPYMLAVTSIGGIAIAQSAFQTGSLAASVGTTEALGPLTAGALGFGILDEHLDAHGVAVVGVVMMSIVLMLLSIAALARAEERLVTPGGHRHAAPDVIVRPVSDAE
jgi:drug/metabolite transporter (DMT)-like permease